MKDVVKRTTAEREKEFEEGYKAASEWAEDLDYMTMEEVLRDIEIGDMDFEVVPDEYIHGSEEFQKGFKSALRKILAPRWRKAEDHVKKVLEEKFAVPLRKKKIIIGEKPHEFDLVSPDDSIVVQVKSSEGFESQNSAHRRVKFAECILDCVLLERTKAKKKIFVLTDKPLYDWFTQESRGLISPKIEVMYIEMKGE